MDKDDMIKMANDAGIKGPAPARAGFKMYASPQRLLSFAALVAAAEREKVARWMMERGYATGHADSMEDLLQELDWQIAENWTRGMVNGVHAEQAAKQEPVAWMVYTLDGTAAFVTLNPADFTGEHRALPLYTTPQPQEFVCSTGLCHFTLTQTNVGIGERGMQAYEEAKKRGWVGISDEGEKPAG